MYVEVVTVSSGAAVAGEAFGAGEVGEARRCEFLSESRPEGSRRRLTVGATDAGAGFADLV